MLSNANRDIKRAQKATAWVLYHEVFSSLNPLTLNKRFYFCRNLWLVREKNGKPKYIENVKKSFLFLKFSND